MVVEGKFLIIATLAETKVGANYIPVNGPWLPPTKSLPHHHLCPFICHFHCMKLEQK